ncbi:MAG: hypothetical protein JWN60_2668 [Acidobacteria bacterium]|jgi:hypothetical protein|nr:hypothetical protein [Acidobacteriota bacterium]
MKDEAKDIDNKVRDLENSVINPSQVKGWGIDADPKNDPTYPMKKRNNGEHAGYSWERPPQQPIDIEVLHSNERPNVSATFGTSVPPSGLSGVIRREAFNFSENSYGHWLPLMLADRINMVEGIVSDLARGHVPNIFGEMGWKADWKHDRANLVTKVVIGAALGTAVFALLRNRRKSRRTENYF